MSSILKYYIIYTRIYVQQDVWSDGCGSFSDMNFIF